MRATAALALLVRRAFFGVLVRLIAVVGGRGARYVRWVEFVPVSFWRRRFRRPKLPRPALPDLRLELLLLGVLLTATGSRWSDPEKWPDRPGNLPPLAGGAVNKAEKSGKWSETTTWSAKKVPGEKEDVEINTAVTVKLEAEGSCRSLNIKGTGVLEGNSKLKIGSSEKPENPAGAALELAAGERIKGTVELKFVSTFTTSALKISAATVKEVELTKTAKYELTGALVAKAIQLTETASLDTKGQSVEATQLIGKNKAKLTLGASVVTLTVAAGSNALAVEAENVIAAETSVIKIQKGNFNNEGTHTWNTIELEGENQEVKSGTETIEKLVLANGGKSTKFAKSTTLKLKTLEAPGSTKASPTKIESSEAGKEFKIEFTGANTLTNLIVKDNVATGTEPVDEYEGEEATYKVGVTSGWKFKAIGGGAAVLELAAAKSESAASMALSAQTQLGFAAGVSSSAAVLSLQAPTQVGLAAALSASGATLGLSAPTQLALGAGVSSSTAAMALRSPTQLAFAAAASASSGTLGLRAPTQLVLGTGASTSSATMVLEVPSSAAKLVLAPAASASAASMGLQAATRLAFTTGQSFSSGTLGLRAPAQLGLAAGVSTSSATFVLLTPSPAVLGLSPASSTSAGRLTLFTAAPLVGLIFGEGGTMTLVGFGVGGTGASPSAAGGTEGAPLGAGGSMVASGAVGLGAIYWANADIGRAQLDGTGVTDSFIPNGFAYGVATAPGAIFALVREGGLGRYPLSGGAGASDVELSPAWYGPNILATDDTYAYYGSKSAGHIERVRLDLASGSVQVLVTGVNPRGIAVSATKIFWTEWEGETARIFTAPKAGGAKTELPLPGFPEGQEPWGILVVGEHLFFSTVGVAGLGEHEGRVWRCGLDGTGIAGFVPLPSAHTPEWVLGSWAGPLATDGTFLYYGSMGAGGHKVGRIGLDDTGQSDFWLDVGEFVFALAVTPPGEAAVPGIASGAGGSLAGVFGAGGNR